MWRIEGNGADLRQIFNDFPHPWSIFDEQLKRALPIIVLSSVLAMGCARAAHTTGEVTEDTGSAVGSVLGAVGAVIMWPFHVVGDLFS